MNAFRTLLVAAAFVLATLAPGLAQRAGIPPPFPAAGPIIARFHQDPRVERLDGYLQGLVNSPKDWSDYPVLVGFFAASFRRHPDWIEKLLPAQFDAKTGDAIAAALRLAGQNSITPALRVRLATPGHDDKLNSELAGLPSRLEDVPLATATHLDIVWGAFFATGDMGYVRRILDVFAHVANGSDAVALDVTRLTVAMGGGSKDGLEQIKARHDRATLRMIVHASTAEWALIANAQNFPAVKQLLESYVAQQPDKPAAKSLSAFLKQL